MGTTATDAPLAVFRMLMTAFEQTEKLRRFAASSARPVGRSQPGRGQRAITLRDAASSSAS